MGKKKRIYRSEEGRGLGGCMRHQEGLRLYIERVCALQDQRHLSPREMRTALEALPLSRAEKEMFQNLLRGHLERSADHLHHNEIVSALEELQRACRLAPLDVPLRLHLARVYLQQSKEKGYLGPDLHRAKECVASCLAFSPGHRSALALRKEILHLERWLSKRPHWSPVVTAVGFSLLLLVVAIGIPFALKFFSKKSEGTSIPASSLSPSPPPKTRPVPISFTGLSRAGLRTSIMRSALEPVREFSSYRLQGIVTHGEEEVLALSLRVTGISQEGETLYKREFVVVDAKDPIPRPGDAMVLNQRLLLTVPQEEIVSVRLGVASLKTRPIQEWSDEVVLPVEWGTERSSRALAVAVRKRNEQSVEGLDRSYRLTTLVIRNSGTVPLARLSLALADSLFSVVIPSDPPLLPGEERLFLASLRFPGRSSLPQEGRDAVTVMSIAPSADRKIR